MKEVSAKDVNARWMSTANAKTINQHAKAINLLLSALGMDEDGHPQVLLALATAYAKFDDIDRTLTALGEAVKASATVMGEIQQALETLTRDVELMGEDRRTLLGEVQQLSATVQKTQGALGRIHEVSELLFDATKPDA